VTIVTRLGKRIPDDGSLPGHHEVPRHDVRSAMQRRARSPNSHASGKAVGSPDRGRIADPRPDDIPPTIRHVVGRAIERALDF
jgi:hypothetical protein